MPLILGMSVLLGCQMLGELLTRLLSAPIPGPVFGMVILLLGLLVRGRVPNSLRTASEGLLGYLTLLFVPAGVGLIIHGRLIGDDWLAIAVTLVVSTMLTVVVTALVLSYFQKNQGENNDVVDKLGECDK
ncbi:CidA/LrgA family protein [Halomonas halocynthiae]|uniref:CidA/LrgA family protein n=1 Tax=Halomonas halocynthiae TaxID=176290 RepID=UPI0004051404|nr:CidA/LrgA family protein [Halomonas halocynthiae]